MTRHEEQHFYPIHTFLKSNRCCSEVACKCHHADYYVHFPIDRQSSNDVAILRNFLEISS